VRVPDLRTFREVIVRTCAAAADARPCVIVPNRAAARQLARLEAAAVTRDELYDRLHARLPDPPRRLTAFERDVIAQRAARDAAAGEALAFRLRPGLVAEMLRFYDQLRRQSQQVRRFEELMFEALGGDVEPDLTDTGASRLRQQTRFLAAAFREYERRVAASGACDEHLLRDRLIAVPAADPIRHVVVTVADWIADAEGLSVADFDLLSRIPGLESLDIVATEAILGSGFHERLHGWLPGIEETDAKGLGIRDLGFVRPVLVTPTLESRTSNPESQVPNPDPWWTSRDREEELVAIARQIKADRRSGDAAALDRTAIVFKHPLPYLYVAAETLPAAGIPYQTFDALPLAAEPIAASLDLALEAVSAGFGREPLVALLRSPHLVCRHEGEEVGRESIAALDRALSDRRYLGDPARLEEMASNWPDGPAYGFRFRNETAALPALHASLAVVRELAPLSSSATASQQAARLLAFWDGHLRPVDDEDRLSAREQRGRAAIRQTLSSMAAVHAAHDDPDWAIDDLALAVRRAVEEQTFEPESPAAGVSLLDDRAARYGDFDDVSIVGLVETDWPERPRRNIFYPPALLKSLGWPSEKDRRAAADAHFLDLLAGARRRTLLSTFTLDDDAIVSRSTQLDEVPRARLSTIARGADTGARVFVDEALSLEPAALSALDGEARAWADLRVSRSPSDEPQFHGSLTQPTAEPAETAERSDTQAALRAPRLPVSVSALETYLDCPFKFFAQHVLKLDEEPDDEEVMDPRRQGQFVHEVFERFFKAWQEAGHRAITTANLDVARELFVEVVDRALEALPEAEAGLERTRLLGSAAAAGLGDAVFRMEAERPVAVVERLLEHRLDGVFTMATADGPRAIALRGKADRLDLLEDGTFRLIDYKLGWPPDRGRALQLPIYGVCAEQSLASHRGRKWTLGEAMYLAFKGPRRVVPLYSKPEQRAKVLGDAQQRLADTVAAIARGEFPPTPDDVWRCETCTFAAVCRKDYVGDV
jgi:RecB family exonuclease/inactivated superfamily I helicase